MEVRAIETDSRLLPNMGSVREGVHVSSLIAEIESTLGVEREPLPYPIPSTYALVGIAWEAYVRAKTVTVAGPAWDVPIEKDGIIGTLDGYDWVCGEVIECKATWQSSNKEPGDIWKWMCQVKAYCMMAHTNEAHMYILHVCGNWKPPQPVVKERRLTFTDRELRENWQMLKSQRERN